MNLRSIQYIHKIVLVVFFCLIVFNLQSQTDPETESDSTRNIMGEEGGKNYAPAYYFYINSLFPSTVEQTLIDTLVFYPYNEDISLFSKNLYATLGIFGQANFSMNFSFDRKHGFNYKTLPYNTYLRTIENWRFYALDEVYSHLQYNFTNGKEHHFSVEHAQQITENLHFGLALESVIAEGRYVRQKMRDVNVGGILRYKLPSDRYGFNAYYYLNFINPQENGGLEDDEDFKKDENPVSSINMRFANNSAQASNKFFQNKFFFRHYLSLSGKADSNNVVKNKVGYLVHDLEISSSKNMFSSRNLNPAYFDLILFDSAVTEDQTKYFNVRNSLFWSSYMPEDTLPNKRNFIRFAAGIMYDFHHFRDTMNFIKDYPFTPVGVLYVKLFNRLYINANTMITLNGYNAGDITLEGEVGLDFATKNKKPKHQLVANIGFYNYSPDYFFSRSISNNYMWIKNLKKQQTITLGVKWKHQNYSVGLNYYTLNNYTLLDEISQPMQVNKFVNVYQLAAYIPFHFKGFGFTSNIYLQCADNDDYIRIPVFATRQTVYYGLPLFKKALYLQFGLDFLYNTAYYGDAYNPVLQQFYLQNDTKIGNYGYMDFYLRAKIGRFQLQFKLTHLWAGAFGKVYYLVPHYPAKDLGFALGIAWRFHD